MTVVIKNGSVTIDEEDSWLIEEYDWYVDNSGYVIAWLPKTREFLRMHRFILKYNGPLEVDHINGDKTDNRKSNLRLVEHYKNLHNSKLRSDNTNGYKGVFLNRSGNWGWQTWIKGVKSSKQGYKTREEAYHGKLLFLSEHGIDVNT